MEFIHNLNDIAFDLISKAPYLWIFIFMTLESTFIPMPSEIVMPPAWYFAAQWQINFWLAVMMWVLWSITWASINYLIAIIWWEKISIKILWHKYHTFWINFFKKNWKATTFIWRLLPWVRHFISFPAGLFRMKYKDFVIYTALWSAIWVTFLTYIWYVAWKNAEIVHQYKIYFVIWTIVFIWLIVWIKILILKKYSK